MGKINNSLKMLAYLRNRKKATRKEIAEYLEIGIREVTRYKEYLEAAGINITEQKGRYGGYILEDKDYLLPLELTQNEESALNEAKEFINNKGYYFSRDFQSAIEKINVLNPSKNKSTREVGIYTKGTKAKVNYKEESNKWLTINEAIHTKRKIKITYTNAMGIDSERSVHPYGLYTYYDSNYFVGYCEKSKNLRQFKIVRIQSLTVINETFESQDFDIKAYLDNSIGVFKDTKIEVKLKITYPYAQGFKEVQWVQNEIIEKDIKGEYIIYKATMEGKPDIISFIMGMGKNCEVLEPADFREEVIETYKEVLRKY